MTRVALFVVAVAALVYLALEALLEPWLGLEVERTVAISASVIAGILAWTGFLWRTADRLGRERETWHDIAAGEDGEEDG